MRNYNTPNYNIPRSAMPMCAMPVPEPRMTGNCDSCPVNPADCDKYPVGMAYVPWQAFRNLYESDKGFHAGTIFMELDKPFYGKGGLRKWQK